MAIHHVVFIKFKADAPRRKINRFIAELNKLPEYNREVKNWISGFSPEPRFHNAAFDYGLACDLADWDAMDRYMYHEGHLRMAPFAEEVFDYSMSFDFVTEFVQPKRYPRQAQAKAPAVKVAAGHAVVPPLMGRAVQQTAKLLKAAGLTRGAVSTQRQPLGLWVAGRVIGQEPAAGAVVPRGTAVNVMITGESWMHPERPPA